MSMVCQNHLGNILTTVSDQKLFDTIGAAAHTQGHYVAQAVTVSDYYPFGHQITDRSTRNKHRYAFNGKEQDTQGEWGSSTTAYDYGFRIYHPGVGRFMSVDPLAGEYPFYTPYQFAGNKPIAAIDLDGLEELIVHSAYWTKKLMEVDLHTMSTYEIISEANRINDKGYINNASKIHAQRHYQSQGQVVTVNPSPDGSLNITGFTNANSGDVIKFSIFSSINGGAISIDIPTLKNPNGLKERIRGKGVQDIAGTFVMQYSGFGKIGRALINHMEGEDPWTGTKGSSGKLVIGGVTDLATLGFGGSASVTTNVVLNATQEALDRLNPDQIEEIGIGREAVDIGLSLSEPNKLIKTVEVISNLVQAGYLTNDLIDKHQQKGEVNNNQN